MTSPMNPSQKKTYSKIIANVNEDTTSKRRSDYFIIDQAEKLGRQQGLLASVGGHITHGASHFAEGALSYPITWWAANIHLFALAGSFGTQQKQRANIRQVILKSLLDAVIKHPVRSGRVMLAYQKHKLTLDSVAGISRLAGRFTGAAVTNFYLLRSLKPLILQKIGGAANSIYSFYGAMILAVAKGVRSLENLAWAGISGEYDFPKKETLIKISEFEATEEELEEAFLICKPLFQKIQRDSQKRPLI